VQLRGCDALPVGRGQAAVRRSGNSGRCGCGAAVSVSIFGGSGTAETASVWPLCDRLSRVAVWSDPVAGGATWGSCGATSGLVGLLLIPPGDGKWHGRARFREKV